jgi:hypothetical protein
MAEQRNVPPSRMVPINTVFMERLGIANGVRLRKHPCVLAVAVKHLVGGGHSRRLQTCNRSAFPRAKRYVREEPAPPWQRHLGRGTRTAFLQ